METLWPPNVGDSVSSPNLCTNDEVKSLACTNAWCVFAPCKRVDSSLNNSWPTPSHAVYVEPSNKSSISKKNPDTDRFYISLASDRLRSASNAFHLTAQKWRQNGLRAQTLLDNLSKMLNSNEQFEMDDSFNLSVVHVRPPPRRTGKKRQHVPGHQSKVRLKQMKKSVIEMPRDDAGWCAARAIVMARGLSLAGHNAHARKQWIHPRRCVHRRQQAAEALAREVGLGPGA